MQLKATKNSNREGSALFARGLIRLRAWEMQNLPHSQSGIAFDLFVLIASAHLLGEPLTLKRLFNSLQYSERGVRNVLEQFISGGWCTIGVDDVDRRVRLVEPTPRLVETFLAYQETLLRELCAS